ncbi:MAG: ABC transporter ATP-binding protein [Desulfobacteraceae bacterium]|nr:MAG: ABC transporter ATP-binding protein [Desulfobacteraceae bacterium]
MPETLIQVRNLKTYFLTERGVAKAVDDVSFDIREGETLAIVGESGCGKSVTALSIMGLIPNPPGEVVGGTIHFNGRDLLKLSEREMRHIRGNNISMIFQEPMTSLNPVFQIGDQITEVLTLHQKINKREARDRAIELLKAVRIPAPESRMADYPHQMSGGMRQRVMIAMALACSPKMIIADEPTTALDVTIQAQILELMEQLSETTGTAILLITHNLGVVAETSHDVIVMYAGRVVEKADAHSLYGDPRHPYTQGLMGSIPGIRADDKSTKLEAIPGMVPSLFGLPKGCKFNDRCKFAFDRCLQEEPELKVINQGHEVRCWLFG